MRVCQRNGWTLATWWSLSSHERDLWLAYDTSRLYELIDDVGKLSREEKLTPDGWLNARIAME